MPRKSAHRSEESPVPRRQSARIAAVQAASPAKPQPVKSPRRKRQSAEASKAASEDTESQQSHAKSEVSIDELNGIETASSTKDSVADSQDLPSKKPRTDEDETEKIVDTRVPIATTESPDKVTEVTSEIPAVVNEATEVIKEAPEVNEEPVHPTPMEQSAECPDFEVVEKTSVPAPDSEEVKAAISAQGEDGSLLVDFVQVDKTELPSATSIEVKHVSPVDEPSESATPQTVNEVPEPEAHTHHLNSVNGNGQVHSDATDMFAPVDASPEPPSKAPIVQEAIVPSVPAPAAGDVSADAVDVGVTSQ